jgi:hypothetical protein
MLLPGIEWNKAPHRHGEFFHADATIVQISNRRNSDTQEGRHENVILAALLSTVFAPPI